MTKAAKNRDKRPKTKSTITAARSIDQSVKVRLNVLIPESLHYRVKMGCLIEKVSMTDVVTEFLEGRFPAKK
jgi:hypothetical protein